MKELMHGNAPRAKQKLMRTLAAAFAALTLLAGMTGCQSGFAAEQTSDSDKKQTAPETAKPADSPTAEPAAAPENAQHEPAEPAEQASFTISRQVNGRAEWSLYSQRLLAGKDIEEQACSLRAGAVFFGMDENALTAYNKALLLETDEGLAYELLESAASFPKELGEAAQKSLTEHYRKYLNPDLSDDGALQMMGYFGKDYIIFTSEAFQGKQAGAVFRTDDGWKTRKELPLPEGVASEITGGCILSDRIGFICYEERSSDDNSTANRLSVYKTEDDGQSWKDIGLSLPQSETGITAEPTIALSPMFDGEHGIMLVTYTEYVKQRDAFDGYIGWFESFDGGESWEFHADPASRLGR